MATTKWKLIKNVAKAHKPLLVLTLLAGFAYNVVMILIPISFGKFYEFAFGFSSHRLKAFGFIPYMDATDPQAFLILFFSLVALRFAFEYGNRYGIALVGEQFAKTLRDRLFAAQLQISMPVYEEKGTGKYLLRFSGDLKSIQNYVKNGILRFIQDVLLLGIVFLSIAYMDGVLALLILGFIGISALLLWSINKVLYRQSLEKRNRKSGMLTFVNTRLRGIASLKAFNKYTPENKRYRKRSEKLYGIGKRYANTVSFLQACIPALTYCLLGVIMLYVLSTSFYQKDSGGSSLLIIILLLLAILPVLRRTLKVSIVWKLGNISFEKLINILELPKENELPYEKLSLENHPIRLENVNYSYGDMGSLVFADLSLEILPKTTTLFHGPSGSGKSTLIKLLLKSISPEKGRLVFGKTPFSSISEKTIRKHLAVVSSDYPLYGKDVYEAIVYSRNTERKARAHRLLQRLQQYEKPEDRLQLGDRIGDLGGNLNSGQTKLLLYCRALLTDKPFLIIEEPLECLSPKTARVVSDILIDLQGYKTIIVLSQTKMSYLKPDNSYDLHAERNQSPIELEIASEKN